MTSARGDSRVEPTGPGGPVPPGTETPFVTLHGVFVLGFIALGIGATYYAVSFDRPPFSENGATVISEAAFIFAASLALVLTIVAARWSHWLHPSRPALVSRIAGRQLSGGWLALAGPIVAAISFVALSGPYLLAARSSGAFPPAVLLEVSLFLIGGSFLLGAWALAAILLLVRTSSRVSETNRADVWIPHIPFSRSWLRPLPAVVIATLVLIVIAYPLPPGSPWRIDGNISKWISVSGEVDPTGDALVVAPGPMVTLDYPAPGAYDVILEVTNAYGMSNETRIQVKTPNAAPSARFTTTVAGLDVSLDATGSSDLDDALTGFDWNFGDGGVSTGMVAEHAYYATGTYHVVLVVTDARGASATTSQNISVQGPNRPPFPALGYSVSNCTLTASAWGSADPDGFVSSFRWTFGDGGSAATMNTTHTYALNGTYNVTLNVTDDQGASSSRTAAVPVPNPPPTAIFGVQLDELTAFFDARNSTDDGWIVSADWEFGDGSSGEGLAVSHQYPALSIPHVYTPTLTVRDNLGATANRTEVLSVAPAPAAPSSPVARFSYNVSGLFVTFVNNGSYDPDGFIVGYYWSFGDGSYGTESSASHLYTSPGNYSVSLRVVDTTGLSGLASRTVVLASVPPMVPLPTARISARVVGNSVTLDGTSSTAPTSAVVGYLWALPEASPGIDLVGVKIHRQGSQVFLYASVAGDLFPFATTSAAVTFYFETSNRNPHYAIGGIEANYAVKIVGQSGTLVSAGLFEYLPSSVSGIGPQWRPIGTVPARTFGIALETMIYSSDLLLSPTSSFRLTCAIEAFGSAADTPALALVA